VPSSWCSPTSRPANSTRDGGEIVKRWRAFDARRTWTIVWSPTQTFDIVFRPDRVVRMVNGIVTEDTQAPPKQFLIRDRRR